MGQRLYNNDKHVKCDSAVNRKELNTLVKNSISSIFKEDGARKKNNRTTTAESYTSDSNSDAYIIGSIDLVESKLE